MYLSLLATCPAESTVSIQRYVTRLVRAIMFAVLFAGLALLYFPARSLLWSILVRPNAIGVPQAAGLVIGTAGAAVALWCVLTFAWIGRGTPAPFAPPVRLVTRGPYRFVRNPMYLGVGTTLAGAAVYYTSPSLVVATGLFFLATHPFVVWYEEPTLRRTFGRDYEAYLARARRWRPTRPSSVL